MFETSKHVPKTEKPCCVFKDNYDWFSPVKKFETGGLWHKFDIFMKATWLNNTECFFEGSSGDLNH